MQKKGLIDLAPCMEYYVQAETRKKKGFDRSYMHAVLVHVHVEQLIKLRSPRACMNVSIE
jgi:hypothetical protein